MVSLHCDPSGLRGAQGEAGNAPPPPPLAFGESPRAPRAGDQRRQTGVGPPHARALHPGGRGEGLRPQLLGSRSRRTAHLDTGRLPRPRSPTPSPLRALAPAPLPPGFPRRAPRCHPAEAPLFAREEPRPSPPPRDPGTRHSTKPRPKPSPPQLRNAPGIRAPALCGCAPRPRTRAPPLRTPPGGEEELLRLSIHKRRLDRGELYSGGHVVTGWAWLGGCG